MSDKTAPRFVQWIIIPPVFVAMVLFLNAHALYSYLRYWSGR